MTSDDTIPLHVPEAIGLEFVFQVRLFFKERMRFEPTTPLGGRVYVPPASGDIRGPRLQGTVMPYSGADWARGRSDGVAELNAHYMLQASDGTPIYINNRGFLYGRGEDGRPLLLSEEQKKAEGFKIKRDTYFRITPVFDAPVGPHDWLTRTIIVGRGRRVADPDHTVFDYYAVT
jgi:hypothetical protein